jgi:hypothetical protein
MQLKSVPKKGGGKRMSVVWIMSSDWVKKKRLYFRGQGRGGGGGTLGSSPAIEEESGEEGKGRGRGVCA